MFSLYLALVNGDSPKSLPAPSTTFREYVARERNILASTDARDFWKAELQDAASTFAIRAEKDEHPTRRTGRLHFDLSENLTASLRMLSQTNLVPLKSVFLAAHIKLISLLCASSDILTSQTTHGRPEEIDGDDVRGLFLNTTPLRFRIRPSSWSELIREVFNKECQLRPYQGYPLGEIQSRFARNSLLQSAFLYLDFHIVDDVMTSGSVQLAGSTKEIEEVNFPLQITIIRTGMGSRTRVAIDYQTAVFDADIAQRVATYFSRILDALASHPASNHQDLVCLSASELEEFRAPRTIREYSDGLLLPQLLEAQVERTPDHIAVAVGRVRLTYRELNISANILAWRLRKIGVGPEVRVGIYLNRNIELIVALLAVLKAGGAYLPLDPEYPPERLSRIVDDSGLTVLLSEKDLPPLHAKHRARSINVDLETLRTSEYEPDTLPTIPHESAAYILYTSGSTGYPKGVVVTHLGLANYLRWANEYYRPQKMQCTPIHTSIAFDLTITSIYLPLLSGGRIELLGFAPGADSLRAFWGTNETFGVVKLTPAHLQLLSSNISPEPDWKATPTFVVGGDALSYEQAEFWRRKYPSARIINEYGPTEATVGCSIYEIGQDDPRHGAVPIGCPIANTVIYALDASGLPTPESIVGELYIAGCGLARCYLNQPGLTAERFVPNPFGPPGSRMYRTGDLAYRRPDRRFEFLGRNDTQVKIRGYRIELGEIEAVLRGHPSVREVVVQPSGDRLVAYILRSEEMASWRQLRAYAGKYLPITMVPSEFVLLDEFPLTENGKVARNLLSGLAISAPEAKNVERPRDDAEWRLLGIWEDLVATRPIDIHDHFFEVGGHSLLALQLISRIKRDFGTELPLTVLFQEGTIAKLAAVLGKPIAVPVSPLVPIQPKGDRLPLFCVQPIGGSVYCYSDLSRHLGPLQPFFGLGTRRWLVGDEESYDSVESFALAYASAIRAHHIGPYLLGGWSSGGVVAYETARVLSAWGCNVPLLVLLDTHADTPEITSSDIDLLIEALQQLYGGSFDLTPRDVADLPPSEQYACIRDRIVAAGLFSPDLEAAQLEEYVRRQRNADRLTKSYHAKAYAGKVVLFRTNSGAESTKAGPQVTNSNLSPTHGWELVTRHPIEVFDVPGDHLSLPYEPNVQFVATIMSRLLLEIVEAL